MERNKEKGERETCTCKRDREHVQVKEIAYAREKKIRIYARE